MLMLRRGGLLCKRVGQRACHVGARLFGLCIGIIRQQDDADACRFGVYPHFRGLECGNHQVISLRKTLAPPFSAQGLPAIQHHQPRETGESRSSLPDR